MVKNTKHAPLFLGVIILLSVILRFFMLGENSFVADEFLDINATYGYAQTGEHQSWDFNVGDVAQRQNAASDARAWLYREQVATLFQFLPPTEFVARSISALWGVCGVIIIYFVTFSFTRNRTIALLAAFLAAVCVPVVEIDRKIRLYAMFGPLFLLLSWAFFQFLETGTYKSTKGTAQNVLQNIFSLNYVYLVPVTLLGLIAFHLHPLTANIVFVFIMYCTVMMIVCRNNRAALVRYASYVGITIIVALATSVLAPSQWHIFADSLIFFEDHWSYVGHITRSFWHPLLGAFLMIGGIVHLTQYKDKDGVSDRKRLRQKAGIWIASTFIVIVLAAVFLWERNVGPQYIFFIQSFALMLAAAGIYALAAFVRENTRVTKAFLITLALALLLVPNYAYFFERNNTYHLKSDADTPNYREVFTYVRKDFTAGDALVTRNFRSYYFSGFDAVVYDFGSERDDATLAKEGKVKKITLAHLQEIIAQHDTGWIVYSDNDEKWLEKELRTYVESGTDARIQKIEHVNIRGKISVYKWTK